MAQPQETMQALVFNGPGDISDLSLTNTLSKPSPTSLSPTDVLIRVAGAGLIGAELSWRTNPTQQSTPAPAHVVCPDYSGTVVAVGSAVTFFHPGDHVMAVSVDFDIQHGVRRSQGGAAEYAVAPEEWVTRAPKTGELRDAAAIPLCAYTAWQACHGESGGKVKPGAEVLVAGAAGATGLWVVQVAKLLGARVTAMASDPEGIKLLRGFGVDEVLNYKTQDVEEGGRRFDVVIDAVGGDTFAQCTNVVKLASEGGLLLSLVEYEAKTQAPEGVDAKFFIWRPVKHQMEEIVSLVEAGKLTPVIDSRFPLSQGVKAFSHAINGHCHGKVVLYP